MQIRKRRFLTDTDNIIKTICISNIRLDLYCDLGSAVNITIPQADQPVINWS